MATSSADGLRLHRHRLEHHARARRRRERRAAARGAAAAGLHADRQGPEARGRDPAREDRGGRRRRRRPPARWPSRPAPTRVRTVATAAIRGAANRDEFVEVVGERGGVEVAILEGEEEARLAFLGATRTLGRALDGHRRRGRRRRRLDRDRRRHGRGRASAGGRRSGSARATSPTSTCARTRPPPRELRAMRAHAAGVFGALDVPRPDAAVAVGGSAASLRRLVGAVLEPETIAARAARALATRPAAEVADALRARPAARAAAARRDADPRRRRAAARLPAADRQRRPARGRAARARAVA